MKTKLLSGIILIMGIISATAQEQTQTTDCLFKNLKYSYFLAEAGYINLPIKNITTHGFGLSMNGVFNNHFVTGFSLDAVNTKQLSLPTSIPVISPQYSYMLIAWNNEYLFSPHKLFNASFQLKTGMGKVTYADKSKMEYYYSYDPNTNIYTQTPYPKVISDDGFFVLEPGINLFVNLTPCISIGGGGHYRFSWGVDKAGTNMDFTNYSLTAMLRFKLDSPECNQCK